MWTHFGSLPGHIPGYPLGELFIIASWGYNGRPWRLYGSSTLPLGKAEKCMGTLQEVWKGFRVGDLPSWLVQLSWYAPLAWSVYQLGGPPPRRYNLWHKDPGGHPEFPPLSSLANLEYAVGQPCAHDWPTRFEGWVNWPPQSIPLAIHVHWIGQPDLRDELETHVWKNTCSFSLSHKNT